MNPSDKDPGKLRLQVFLSRNGVCSRRRALDMVKTGRVSLNGQVCREPSTPVDPRKDHVAADGKKVGARSSEYILLHKPAGYTTTKSDRFAKKTVLDLLPTKYKYLSPAGRLDKDTEGLLLLTNDGDAANRLTHPKFNVDKIYYAKVCGRLTGEQKSRLERGVYVDGARTAPAKIHIIRLHKDRTELTIIVHEGRKRQVRRMLTKVGHKVMYLKRTQQGPLKIGTLKRGAWRPLNSSEIKAITRL